MRMDSRRWYAKVCPLFCVRRIAHIVLIHLGVKRGETIRNMGVESDTRFTSITRVYLGRALGAHQHDVGVHPKER